MRKCDKTRREKTSAEIQAALENGGQFGERVMLHEMPRRIYDYDGQPKSYVMVRVECSCGRQDDVIWSALKAGHADRCRECAHRNAMETRREKYAGRN